MKTLPKIQLEKNGIPLAEQRTELVEGVAKQVDHPLTTGFLIRVAIESTVYSSAKEQHDAFKVYEKIEEDADGIVLEDAEFETVEKLCKNHKPYLSGVIFVPFLKLFDQAIDSSKK